MQKRKGAGKGMNDRDAECPFFRRHTKGAIGCESPIPGSCIQINFQSRTAKQKHYAGWCCANFKYCEIYRMMEETYDEEG